MAILSSQLADFATYQIEVDCGTLSCPRSRRYELSDLAGLFGKQMHISELLRRLRWHCHVNWLEANCRQIRPRWRDQVALRTHVSCCQTLNALARAAR